MVAHNNQLSQFKPHVSIIKMTQKTTPTKVGQLILNRTLRSQYLYDIMDYLDNQFTDYSFCEPATNLTNKSIIEEITGEPLVDTRWELTFSNLKKLGIIHRNKKELYINPLFSLHLNSNPLEVINYFNMLWPDYFKNNISFYIGKNNIDREYYQFGGVQHIQKCCVNHEIKHSKYLLLDTQGNTISETELFNLTFSKVDLKQYSEYSTTSITRATKSVKAKLTNVKYKLLNNVAQLYLDILCQQLPITYIDSYLTCSKLPTGFKFIHFKYFI